jgi:hypothetical protein
VPCPNVSNELLSVYSGKPSLASCNFAPEAWLAALAIESGAEWIVWHVLQEYWRLLLVTPTRS